MKFFCGARHETERWRLARADGDRAGDFVRVRRLDLGLHPLGKVHEVVGALPERDAFLGQRDSARAAMKEPVPEFVLQRGELRGERGLRNVQPFSGEVAAKMLPSPRPRHFQNTDATKVKIIKPIVAKIV